MQVKERIDFVDLAKGICIILVVMYHVGINIPYLGVIRMPLYFVLSGLFYKSYGSIKCFVVKKINKILVPFVVFYLLGCAIYYFIKYICPVVELGDNGLLSVFTHHYVFNTPVWFLLCLFWVSVIFCFIETIFKNSFALFLCVVAVGLLGRFLHRCDISMVR